MHPVSPSRPRRYALAVIACGAPLVAAAAYSAAGAPPGGRDLVGVALFFLFALAAELRPVPIDAEGKRNVSLAFVFIVATQLLFGWQWAVLTGTAGIAVAMAAARRPLLKVAFNAATYAVAAALAAGGCGLVFDRGRGGYGTVIGAVVVSGAIFAFVNVVLVCVAIGLSSGSSLSETIVDHLRRSGPIFAIMVFVAAQAVIFWRLSGWLVLLLSAPVFALSLYQRSHIRSRIAEAEAATDGLTALKNRRAFEDEAARALAATDAGSDLSLCLIDIDHFKHVNDRHGHPTGDALLGVLARALEEVVPGRGYRLGGDELAFLVDAPVVSASETADAIREVFAAHQVDLLPEPVTISAGIASLVNDGSVDVDLHSLVKHADLALYQSKNNGRARSTVYAAEQDMPGTDELLSSAFPTLDIRLVTARRLATLVDALADASADARGHLLPPAYTDVLDRWQSFDGNHSEAVAVLTVALGRRLGLSREELDQVRLAALLHDIGKIAVPERILSKPGPLTETERLLVERHPLIGFQLLRDLGLAPVDTYVRHHHERWDGNGYPDRLAGADIPFGSRVILVADSFDALTSDRAYRNKVSIEAAMRELQGEAGRQLDPLVVAALHDHLSAPLELGGRQPEPAWSS